MRLSSSFSKLSLALPTYAKMSPSISISQCWTFLCLVVLTSLTVVAAQDDLERVEFTGHQVLRLSLNKEHEWVEILEHIQQRQPNHTVDIWKGTAEAVDLMVSPADVDVVDRIVQERNLSMHVMLDDVGKFIQSEETRSNGVQMSWDAYHRASVIHQWMHAMAKKHSNMASIMTIGTTFEGRPLKVMKIDTGKSSRKVFIDAGIHAREWIAPATATYIMNEMLNNYEKHQEFVDSFQWYFLPIFNIDGYEFSHTKNRLWRKTRSTFAGPNVCPGADANRNFAFHWKERSERFSTPCDENFPGVKPESERIVTAFRDFILKLNKQKELVAYFSLHAYGQLWLLPYGYTKAFPNNYKDMMDVANAGVRGIKAVRGSTYSAGTAANILYYASGLSKDWVHDVAKVPYAYVVELSPPSDGARAGFLLRADKIKGVGRDLVAGLEAATKVLRKKLQESHVFENKRREEGQDGVEPNPH